MLRVIYFGDAAIQQRLSVHPDIQFEAHKIEPGSNLDQTVVAKNRAIKNRATKGRRG
jgi:hypothetical protein